MAALSRGAGGRGGERGGNDEGGRPWVWRGAGHCPTYGSSLEAKVEELNRELVDRGLLISQLERLGSSLREEAMELRYRYTKREYLYVCTMFIVYSILPAPSLSSRSLACRYLWREKPRNFVPRARAQL